MPEDEKPEAGTQEPGDTRARPPFPRQTGEPDDAPGDAEPSDDEYVAP